MRRVFVVVAAMLFAAAVNAQTAAEGGKFTVSVDGPIWMFFGDKATDRLTLRKYWRGTWDCTTASFRTDPAAGAEKSCFASGVGGYVAEGEKFTLASGGTVWYGSGRNFKVKDLIAGNTTWTCNNSTFGGDPAYGVVKYCRATAMSDQTDCSPAQIGGSGSKAAWGMSISPLQAWAGWWCGDRMQVVACSGDGCKSGVAKTVIDGVATLKGTLLVNRTMHIDAASLRAIWEPHQ
jgi:hypothetical protein